MEEQKLKIGDLVEVPPTVTGYEISVLGYISELEYFMDYTLATVNFLRPFKVNGNRSRVCRADYLIRRKDDM